ncbi:MAG: 1-acyl-sn-glycerol-3-phosphate acyltransferase [Cellvibrionaceae bacterium]
MTKFDDIRPYNDAEVAPAIERVLADPELISAVSKLRFPQLANYLPWLLKPLIRRVLKNQLKGVQSVEQLQDIVAHYLGNMIDERVSELTFSGLEKLDPKKSYLFVSNHRDIAMDPAFVNWVLHQNGHQTVRIAIGDNLLTKPYVSDLMRLNKSFIVVRSAVGAREKYKAAKHLSSYIHHSIVDESNSIWIAQREGRAKDGLDATNTAIVSMIALSKPKKVDFSEFINELNIVPVSLSYEWDPCDAAKSNELYHQSEHGSYEKDEHEDVASIAAGISGEKGHVHVAFGDVLQGDYENADQVAAEIDRQVWQNYVQHPSNHLAYQMLHKADVELPVSAQNKSFCSTYYLAEQQELVRRLDAVPATQRELFLGIYANPVVSQLRAKDTNP